jgi:predicted aspartyl protease
LNFKISVKGGLPAILTICSGVLLYFLFPPEACPEFYKYVDNQGRIYYVDDLTKVPPEYQEQIQIYNDKSDYLTEDEKSAGRVKEQEVERELELERQRQMELELQQAQKREEAEKHRQEETAGDQKLETKVVIEGNRILVPATLSNNGIEIEVLLLLDTGAAQMVLHRDIAEQLNIITLKKGLSQVAGGQTIQSQMGRLSYVKVGPVKMNNPMVIIINHEGPALNYKGLLGMNFLRNVQYNIDFQNQLIRWEPSRQQDPDQ